MELSRFAVIIFFLFPSFLFAQKITFAEHIAPIIFENCTPCHRPNQIAPMPFTNYEEVSSYASMIKYVTEIKYMPPWKTVNKNHHFEGERGLSEQEINLIQKWVEDGVEEGNPAKTPSVPKFDDAPKIKNPDAIFSMSEAFEQYGVYYDQFKVFVLPTHLEEEKMVSAIEFVPGNSTIVRSCFISVDTSDRVAALDKWDPTYGYFSFGEMGFVPNESRWCIWNPLQSKTEFPKGFSKRLPKNAKLLLHIHYGPTGVPLKDSSEVRIKFSKEKTSRNIQNVPLIHSYNLTNPPFEIPANKTIRYHAKFVVPFDMELRALMPHSHLLGNTWEIFTVEPQSKKSQVLLKIDDWDFKWKRQFEFSKPIILKKGTVVHALAQYDNTLKNPSNPSDPPRSMTWGKRMFEELFLVYFEFVPIIDKENKSILFNPSLVIDGSFDFNFSNSENQKLSLTIMDFEEKETFSIFQNEGFSKGKQSVKIRMKDLKKGNYFVELRDENGVVLNRHIFVNVEKDFLD
ncbi:MAG: hypothetical protein AB8H03_04720 [Saprospiraceae bacterium]